MNLEPYNMKFLNVMWKYVLFKKSNVTLSNFFILKKKKPLLSSFIPISDLYSNLKHMHLDPYNVKLLNVM
jgi:hypothetical protein